MAIKAMDEKIHKGGKVSLPVTTSTGDKVASPVTPDIVSLIKREVEVAIADRYLPKLPLAVRGEFTQTY
jgi:hypothetical protein